MLYLMGQNIERENNAKLEMINTELTQATKTIRSIKSGGGGTEPQGIEQ